MDRRSFVRLFVSLILAACLLGSCTGTPAGEPSGSEERTGSAEAPTEAVPPSSGETEPGPETPGTEEPETEEPGPAYQPPEDGSFTVCGFDLSEYVPMLYFTGSGDYARINRPSITNGVEKAALSALGFEMKMKVIKVDKYCTESRYDHEILFGKEFRREGMPEYDGTKSYYGVTAGGTVYFCSPSPMLYPYMWELFLEEFMGVPVGSGERSLGCAIQECYREVPALDYEKLSREGYTLVFEDEFEGDDFEGDDFEEWD